MHDHRLQPLLHDLVSTVMAPTSALSGADGQIRRAGVQGLFHADARVLSEATLEIDGREPEPIGHAVPSPGVARFVSLARWLGDPGADPTVRVERVRRVTPGAMAEEITIASTASAPFTCTVTVTLAADFAPVDVVKSGGGAVPLKPEHTGGTLTWHSGKTRVTATTTPSSSTPAPASSSAPSSGVVFTSFAPAPNAASTSSSEVVLTSSPFSDDDGDNDNGGGEGDGGGQAGVGVRWRVAVAPGERVRLGWELAVADPRAVVAAPVGAREWSRPEVEADDARLVRLARQSLDDLESLRLTVPGAPGETFLGAGVPWFLTLFGRDSIWAARMMLPLGTALAGGTLRVLARHQGVKTDATSGEAPGKIMHELRGNGFTLTSGLRLPSTYYGTIDATPLWIALLHDAWRWGLPEREVAGLLPALEAALGWLETDGDADGDGFLEYLDAGGRGLANQGWKDSGDAVRFRDGSHAAPPIALAEVQGYAHEAALAGAALLEAFGRPRAGRWRDYADRLATRFRERFWVDGGYPALALDRDKRPVDALTSNIGHLLGTGLLTPEEEARIARTLADPAMSGGFGLRTMSAGDAGFSPLSYHCGSVWTHDTAIVIAGLARTGHGAPAAHLAEGLLEAAETFGYRLPELHAGDDRSLMGRAVPYPAACRPQAWSAASAIAILHAAIGIYPDVPGGRVLVRPGAPLGALTVRGLRVAGAPVDVTTDGTGPARLTGLPGDLRVERL
ncbi:glycogen debranching N-terminal domain-containing protein [Nonomuraea sp. NPDC050790]|uniref:glycogen debranching N-terminal domain-containing protein n=1 Tax=Nonomuraea sp. NPDC050790 TaxID=3364371 RepID=UPI003788C207